VSGGLAGAVEGSIEVDGDAFPPQFIGVVDDARAGGDERGVDPDVDAAVALSDDIAERPHLLDR
jgi:hypothetical protein